MKKRDYSPEQVRRLQGTVSIDHTLAKMGAAKLRQLFEENEYINTFGHIMDNRQSNTSRQDSKQSTSQGGRSPRLRTLTMRFTQISLCTLLMPSLTLSVVSIMPSDDKTRSSFLNQEKDLNLHLLLPMLDAGFGGVLNAYELARNLIEAGAAGVHFEDQVAAEKKCGHLGGKVLIPTSRVIRNLNAARLASDVAGTDTVVIARTDAESAKLISSNISDIDKPFIKRVAQGTAGSIQCRTQEGFYMLEEGKGLEFGCVRGQAYAEYADLVWCETSTPCLKDAKRFADAVKGAVPDAMLAYNCSPSFNWRKSIPGDQELKEFQRELGRMGFKFQFITLERFPPD